MNRSIPVLLAALALASPAAAQSTEDVVPVTIDWQHGIPSLPDASVYAWQQADIEADQRHAEAALRHAIAAERLASAAERQADATQRLADALEAQSLALAGARTELAGIAQRIAGLRLTAEVAMPDDVRASLVAAMRTITDWLAPPAPTAETDRQTR